MYALLIAAFIPGTTYLGGLLSLRGLTLTGALPALGIVAAVVVALLLKRTLFRGQTPLFLMELPSYQWPSLRTVFFRVVERAVVFPRCAGTLILAVSILTWAAAYYPRRTGPAWRPGSAALRDAPPASGEAGPGRSAAPRSIAQQDDLHRQWSGQMQRQSYLGRAGHLIEPAVKPLGWDWRIGCAVIASFPAREVVVATLGVIFNVGEEPQGKSGQAGTQFREALHALPGGHACPLFSVPVALSVMVFFALCAQCVATLAVIRRETNSCAGRPSPSPT